MAVVDATLAAKEKRAEEKGKKFMVRRQKMEEAQRTENETEQKLGRELLSFACRHQILELVPDFYVRCYESYHWLNLSHAPFSFC
ncbi:hypothetical protein Btru_065321 [Bulinus truncatus]|nr:hypothetical protein Btru_065321 [Bulinus truncatus]